MGDSKQLKVFSEVMRPFTGEGDVVAWMKKARLVAKLKNIEDVASFLPLYLEGDALSLYLEMSEEDQKHADKIEARLRGAFTDGEFVAYGKLGKIRWTGEQVDVFANEIRRLAGMAGFTGAALDRIVRLTFVNGFPDSISVAMQQIPDIGTMPMSTLIPRARILATRQVSEVAAVAVKGAGTGRAPVGARQNSVRSEELGMGSGREVFRPFGFRGKCYRCNGPHMMRDCKEPRPPVTCFQCGMTGHIAVYCNQGNEQRGATVPVVTPTTE